MGFCAICAFWGLAGCTVGPDYTAPQKHVPSQWGARGIEAGDFTSGEISADVSEKRQSWWEQLEDPELSNLVRQAMLENNNLESARLRVREARALVGVAESQLLPQLQAGANYTQVELSEYLPVLEQFTRRRQVETRHELYSASFDAGWEIDVFGGTRRAIEAGVAQAGVAEAGLADAKLSLRAEVVRNYVNVRLSQQQKADIQRQLQLQEQIVELHEGNFAAGVGTELDVQQASALKHSIVARLPAIRVKELASIYRLSVLTAEQPAILLDRLQEKKPLSNPPDLVPVGLPGEILRRRPDIHKAEMQLRVATAEIGVQTAKLFPRFSLTGMAGSQASRFSDLFDSGSGTWTILPGISWAVFQGGKIRSTVKAAEFRQEQMLEAYHNVIRKAVSEVEGALTRYGQSLQARQSIESMVSEREQSVELIQSAYESGVVDLLDVLEAKRQLTESRVLLPEAQAETLLALTALEKALGGGWDTGQLSADYLDSP